MNNLFLKLLEKAQTENRMIAVKDDEENVDSFMAGYINQFNEETLYLNLIDRYGEEDGFSLISLEKVYQIDFNNRYLKRLDILHKTRFKAEEQDPEELFLEPDYEEEEDETGELILRIIERVKENNILVHIDFFYDYWVIGYVIDMDEEFIVVEVVSEEGDDDGFSCFRVEEIESITGRTNKLRKVEFYYENRRKFYSNN